MNVNCFEYCSHLLTNSSLLLEIRSVFSEYEHAQFHKAKDKATVIIAEYMLLRVYEKQFWELISISPMLAIPDGANKYKCN